MIHIISVASESQSSPRVVCAQLLFGGEELDAVLQLEDALLLRLVLHALVLLEVLGRNTVVSISHIRTQKTCVCAGDDSITINTLSCIIRVVPAQSLAAPQYVSAD